MRYVFSPCLVAVFPLALAACSEYNINSDPSKVNDDIAEGEPDIEVTPAKIDFGQLDVGTGATATEVVTVKNVGTGPLNIEDLSLEDATAPFEFSAIGSILIPPDGSTTFTVTFTPITAEETSTKVLIASNDPDEATSEVKLNGSGVAPVILLDPTSYDYGTNYIGCELAQPITISNIGNADLIVSDFDYVTASAEELVVDENTSVNGEIPWTIPAGESRQVYVNYAPMDERADDGFLVVTSNDPAHSEAQAAQTGGGQLYDDNLDVFEQALRSAADILLVVDNSGSMSEEQTNLANNFESFINVMVLNDADWQIGVITTDQWEFQGDIIRPSDADPVGEFQDQAQVGINGSGDERGNEMAYNALQPGEDAGPGSDFLRDDARLNIVFLSDEVDSSAGSWVDYVNFYWTLKSDTDDVVVHAIAGDWPVSACSSAVAGTGYYETVAATGGLFLSICATDWAAHLESLAEVAATDLSTFDLSQTAVPETIEVRVDGVVQTVGWTYDPNDNSVNFDDDHIPSGGSSIEIEYALYADCSK